MRSGGKILLTLLILIVIASLYRIMPGRPLGFAPQIAIAIFAGAIVKDKRLAFLLPLLSMFISDGLYEILYVNGISSTPGFYSGQLVNYILFASLAAFGFFIKSFNVKRIALAAIAAPTTFFLISNLLVWMSNAPDAGYNRPKTFLGLIQCYGDGLPFYRGSLIATFVFCAVLFGGYYLVAKRTAERSSVPVNI